MDEVEELLDREVKIIKDEKEREEREEAVQKKEEEEQYVTFALRNRQINEHAFTMMPVQIDKPVEKQASKSKLASKENNPVAKPSSDNRTRAPPQKVLTTKTLDFANKPPTVSPPWKQFKPCVVNKSFAAAP